MDKPSNLLTTNLQYLMQNNKITSVDLAEVVGVSAELIGKLKNGILNNPSLKVLIGISKYFNITLDDLIFYDFKNNINRITLQPINYIPIVDWDHIENWREEKANSFVVVDNISSINGDIFALYIDSNYGVFPRNSFIFINDSLKLKNNDYVLVLNFTTKTFSVRKLIIEDTYYLQSVTLDIDCTVKYNEKESLIFGVILGYQKNKIFRCY